MTPKQAVLSPRAEAEKNKRSAIEDAFQAEQARHAAEQKRQHEAALRWHADKTQTVRFLAPHVSRFQFDYGAGYTVGDIAGLDPACAEQLRKQGVVSFDLTPPPEPTLPLPEHVVPAAAAVALRILKQPPGSMYNPGEIAGFSPAVAEKMIKQGLAELTSPASPARRMIDAARRMVRGAVL